MVSVLLRSKIFQMTAVSEDEELMWAYTWALHLGAEGDWLLSAGDLQRQTVEKKPAISVQISNLKIICIGNAVRVRRQFAQLFKLNWQLGSDKERNSEQLGVYNR